MGYSFLGNTGQNLKWNNADIDYVKIFLCALDNIRILQYSALMWQ